MTFNPSSSLGEGYEIGLLAKPTVVDGSGFGLSTCGGDQTGWGQVRIAHLLVYVAALGKSPGGVGLGGRTVCLRFSTQQMKT